MPPPPTCSAVAAADGGLTVDTPDVEVVPDALSSTTHAWEAPAIVHVAALICTMTTLRMCSMECLARVDEAHEAATTIRLEPVVDLIQQEVEQLAHVQATASTLTSTPSTGEDIPPVVVVIDVDPKASVQEQDASPLPSINTTTPVASEMDHNTSLFVSSNLIVLAPTKCSTKYHIHAGDWVKPLFALSFLCPTYAPSISTHTDHPEALHHPSLIAQGEYGAHLVAKSKNRGLPLVWQGIEQPWPPPLRVSIRYIRQFFRPSQCLPLKPLSDKNYPKKTMFRSSFRCRLP
ncbi:hypothetical protein ZWY2020_040442 [Hordeum vulgare]|nr:hypothetical protein ZWY2020_040442 [Hordeum vulgare]